MSEANSKPVPPSMKRPLALALTSAALAVALSVALRPGAGAPDFVQFLGRFHTLAIHLPIGVLLLVAAAEALCLASPRLRARVDPALDLALPFLVVTSVAAFALGLLLARGGGYPSRLVALHRADHHSAVPVGANVDCATRARCAAKSSMDHPRWSTRVSSTSNDINAWSMSAIVSTVQPDARALSS